MRRRASRRRCSSRARCRPASARSKAPFTNFEMVLEWRHHEAGGNSGVFVWCPESAFTDLPPGTLPRSGIEVQVLDPGYETQWLQSKGKRSDWFTSHGDVFPVGASTMVPCSLMYASIWSISVRE